MPPRPDLKRAEKRKGQYLSFLDRLKDNLPGEKDAAYFKKLSDFTKDLFPYLEVENKKKISRNELSSLFNRYVELENGLDELTPQLQEDPGFQKFRTVMGKDIKMIHNVLENSNAEEFDLTEVFDQSRSVTVELNNNDIEMAGANMSSRFHIKDPEDGYFTAHEKPFVLEEEKKKLVYDIVGADINSELSPDDEVRVAVIDYLLTSKGRNTSKFWSEYKNKSGSVHQAGSDYIVSGYGSLDDFKNDFSYILDRDMTRFMNGPGADYPSIKVKQFFDILKNPQNIVKLIDGCSKVAKLNNKGGILRTLSACNEAKMDKRNSAMSMVASMIGVDDVIASSTNMRVNINGVEHKGTFMKKAEGQDIKNVDLDSDFLKVNQAALEGNLQLKKDCANLQILDYLCGNLDRHIGNYLYKFDKQTDENGKEVVKLVGIQGIDNDASFSGLYSGPEEDTMQARPLNGYRVITKSTAEKIMKINPETFRAMLAGFDLNMMEIDKAVSRLMDVKKAIIEGKKANAGMLKGKLADNAIKVVDDEELANLSVNGVLKGQPFKTQTGKSKSPNLFAMVSNTFKADNNSVAQYGRLKHKLFENACQSAKNALFKEDDVISAYNLIKDNKLYFRGSEEYDVMLAKTGALTKLFDKNRENKILTENLENDTAHPTLAEKAQEAIEATNSYIIYKLDDIRKKEEKGEKVGKNDRERLKAAQKNLEKLEELAAEYNLINGCIETTKKLNAEEKDVIKTIPDMVKTLNDSNAQMKKNLATKLDDLNTAKHDLKLDLEYNRTNAQRLKAGLPLEPPYNDKKDILLDAVNLDSRECVIELSSRLSSLPVNNDAGAAEVFNAAEKLNANKLMKHLINTDPALAEKISTDVNLYKNLRDKLIDDMRKLPGHKEMTEKTINTIKKGVDADKKLKTEGSNLTYEEKVSLQREIAGTNTVLRNGIGSEEAERQWVTEFLKTELVKPPGDRKEKTSEFIKEVGNKLANEAVQLP